MKIHALTLAQNETVVSENCSLEVVLMDESQAGVYRLTVSTGHKTLQRSFNVTVLTPTESPSTGEVTDWDFIGWSWS